MMHYPERINNELNDICECGHGFWNHGFHVNLLFKTIRDQCEKCMCPKFKYEKKMTMDEYCGIKPIDKITERSSDDRPSLGSEKQ